jgi:hypothetical protein
MLDWLFESARFSLAGGAFGVALSLLGDGLFAVTGAGHAIVMFRPTLDAAPTAVSSAIGAGVLGGAVGLWSRWQTRRRAAAVTS